MHRKLSLGLAAICALVLSMGTLASAAIITQWNFNSPEFDSNVATGTTTPSIGSGTASVVGGVTATFASGDVNMGSTDPVTGDDSAWQTTNYPAQGTDNKSAGVSFAVSTVGYYDIIISFDHRHSNTSSRYARVQYSVDGGSSWTDSTLFDGNAGDTWFNNRTVDLSSDLAVNNNANFVFRIVAEFAPGGNTYAASRSTSSYGPSGTWRFDMVTVSGTLIPEPATVALLALGGLAAFRRRR